MQHSCKIKKVYHCKFVQGLNYSVFVVIEKTHKVEVFLLNSVNVYFNECLAKNIVELLHNPPFRDSYTGVLQKLKLILLLI